MEVTAKKPPSRTVRFDPRPLEAIPPLMGSAHRSAITGEVFLKDVSRYPDYQLVDLAKRSFPIPGTTEELLNDKYIFKAIPLTYRTWLYHESMKSVVSLGARHDEHSVMKHVFSQWCIDAPTMGGRSSPLPYYVPLAIGTCLTGSTLLVILIIVLIAVVLFVIKVCNYPQHYRRARLYTLPLRIGYAGVVAASFDASTMLSLAGFIVNLALLAADFTFGDLSALKNNDLHCNYTIIKMLPGRLTICFRDGALRWEETYGKRGGVDECVSSLGAWERYHHLIADIGDVLVELQPLNEEDVFSLTDQYFLTGDPIPYAALDVFDPKPAKADARFLEKNVEPSPMKKGIRQDLFLEDL